MCFWVLRGGIGDSLRRRKHALRGELIIGRSRVAGICNSFAIVIGFQLDVFGVLQCQSPVVSAVCRRCWMDVSSANRAKLQQTLRLIKKNKRLL